MSDIHIIVGSMLGGTEYVAESCQQVLEQADKAVTIHFQPTLDEIATENCTWLICTSTHGAGDYPDNIQAFIDQVTHTEKDLSTIKFAVIGMGDSSYDTFCYAAKNTEKLLISKGCNKLFELLTLDVQQPDDPELIAEQWISQHLDQLS